MRTGASLGLNASARLATNDLLRPLILEGIASKKVCLYADKRPADLTDKVQRQA